MACGLFTLRITPLQVVRGDEAWRRISEGQPPGLVAPPYPGFEYLLAGVRVEYVEVPGSDTRYNLADGRFYAASPDARYYAQAWMLGAEPPAPSLESVLEPGQAREGWLVLLVGVDDTAPVLTYKSPNLAEKTYEPRAWWKLYWEPTQAQPASGPEASMPPTPAPPPAAIPVALPVPSAGQPSPTPTPAPPPAAIPVALPVPSAGQPSPTPTPAPPPAAIPVAPPVPSAGQPSPTPTPAPAPEVVPAPAQPAIGTQLTDSPDRRESSTTWSPDGQTILFGMRPTGSSCCSGKVWGMNSDGSDQRQLTSGSFDLEPDFSPDGERVVFVRWPSDRGDYFDLMTMNPVGTGVERVPAGGDITYRNPRWSPDGARLTGWAKTGTTGAPYGGTVKRVVWIMNADGSGFEILAEDAVGPVFTPDGEEIVFRDIDADGLMSMRLSDRTIMPLTKGLSTGAPDVSPDGSRVAFSRESDNLGHGTRRHGPHAAHL